MVTRAIIVLLTAVGLDPADASAELLGQGMAIERHPAISFTHSSVISLGGSQ